MLSKTLEELIEEASKDTTKDVKANVIKEIQDDVKESRRQVKKGRMSKEDLASKEYMNYDLAVDAFCCRIGITLNKVARSFYKFCLNFDYRV